jgi:hypothetical protein
VLEALIGAGRERARFSFKLKQPPVSKRYILGLLTVIATGIAIQK